MGEQVLQDEKLKNDGYRSLFWPIVLICIGVIWLLSNLGIIAGANLLALLRLWPLLLIVVGLDLLIGRRSPLVGALIGLGAVVVIVGGVLVGPSLGLVNDMEFQVSTYEVPREAAASAQIDLDLSIAETTIYSLTDSSNLFEVEAGHVGDLDFTVSGTTTKLVSLGQVNQDFGIFQGLDFLGLAFESNENLYWNVGLANNIPLELNINGGVGNNDLNLSQTQLTGLNLHGGLGAMTLRLPAPTQAYSVELDGGAGEMTIHIPENAALDLNLDGGIGGVLIDVPESAAVRLAVNGGIGGTAVQLASLERTSGEGEDFIDDSGIWQTPNYNEAARQINIEFNGGVGGLTIR